MSTRECGSCSLCCKVLDVPAVYKPAGQWCRHFSAGQGCGIHQLRPKSCRDFACLWLKGYGLDEAWKPTTSKFVMAEAYDGDAILIHVDAKQKNAWRAEPYYSALKAMAAKVMLDNQLIMIVEPTRRFVLTPDAELDIGDPKLLLSWEVSVTQTPAGPSFHIEFEAVDDEAKGGKTVFATAPAG
jgi:hypothetical protein